MLENNKEGIRRHTSNSFKSRQVEAGDPQGKLASKANMWGALGEAGSRLHV